MSNWPWVFSIVVAVIAVVMLAPLCIIMHRNHENSITPLDAEDKDIETKQPNEYLDTGATISDLPRTSTVQADQDDLNYKLWHDLLLLIPNTTWIRTQHQSPTNVQWLCLGPDYYCFIASAELHHDEWKWSFTKA